MAMAEAVEDRDRSAQLGLMALIERQTKEQLTPFCAREGVIVDDAAHQEQGRGWQSGSAVPTGTTSASSAP
jgi:hypothetical protein